MPRKTRSTSATGPAPVPPPAIGAAEAGGTPSPAAPSAVLGTWDALEEARAALDLADDAAAVHTAGGALVRAAQHYTAALLAAVSES